MPSDKKLTPKQTWDALDNLRHDLEAERIASLSASEVDAELAQAGIDAAKLRSEGAAFVERLLADREAKEKRPDWQAAAAKKLAEVQTRFESRSPMPKLPRAELEKRIKAAQNDPRLSGSARVMFRNKKVEEASDDELAALLNELEALAEHKE